MSDPTIRVELSAAEALVLFEWLARFNKSRQADFEDAAEERVLWNLEALLEAVLVEPLASNYADLLALARAQVRDPDS